MPKPMPALLLVALLVPAGAIARFPAPVPDCPPFPRLYLCARTDAAPHIDGRLDDASWDAAPWSPDFVDIEGEARPAPHRRTNFKMLWDEENLYVAARLEEPDVWGRLTERDAEIYHGVATHFRSANIYQAGVVLLDADDPTRVVARGTDNVLEPREPWELAGQVPNVVFPSGWTVSRLDAEGCAPADAAVRIYYGAARR